MRNIINNLTKDRVVAELRKEILFGNYQAGEALYQEKIAEELGVSRLPVREAFQILHNEGLITVKPNKVAFVNEISMEFLHDHFAVRALLEKEAARLACMNKADTSPMYKEYENAEKAISRNDLTAFNDSNQVIHNLIWQAADNVVLERMISTLWNTLISSEEKALEYARESNEGHRKIIEAISRQDAQEAMRLSEEHVLESRDRILKKLNISE